MNNGIKSLNDSKLEKLFMMFAGDDYSPEWRKAPFEMNGKIYATDGYTAIRCDRDKCGLDYPSLKEYKPADTHFEKHNTSQILRLEKILLEPYKTKDEYKEMECLECGGDGQVLWEYKSWDEYFDCPECNGAGYSILEKTGKKTYKESTVVEINNKYFNAKFIERLIDAQEIIDGEIEIVYDSDNKLIFKVSDYEIIVMPIRGIERNGVVINYRQSRKEKK